MSDYISVLTRCALFDGMTAQEIRQLLDCCGIAVRHYGKGEFLWQAGEVCRSVGIVLEGTVDAVEYTDGGEEVQIARQEQGAIFGDLLASAGVSSPVALRASEGATVMLLPLQEILNGCRRQCACHVALRRNLLRETAEKYWELRQQMELLRTPRVRQKILLYLRRQPCQDGYVTIPYSREEMARFLHVDRSALSRELSRMKAEGMLDYYRNTFRLL